MKRFYEVWSDAGLETRRTDQGVAHGDISIFWWLGKKTWMLEVDR